MVPHYPKPLLTSSMESLRIQGGHDPSGEVQISDSKNSSLFLIAAALLASGESVLENVSDISDVRNLGEILELLGAKVKFHDSKMFINTKNVSRRDVGPEVAYDLRGSIVLLGSLLAKFGLVRLAFPGGCNIGTRPIDEHLRGLESLGASIEVEEDYIVARAPKGLHGTNVSFDVSTVTGTITLMLAACLADGETILTNVALEPEIIDLAKCLIAMGGDIKGHGTHCITIRGRESLKPYNFRVMGDPIECGTFLVADALAGSSLTVRGCKHEYLTALISKLREFGADIQVADDDSVTINKACGPKAICLHTDRSPGFATDMQPQIMTLLSVAEGISKIK